MSYFSLLLFPFNFCRFATFSYLYSYHVYNFFVCRHLYHQYSLRYVTTIFHLIFMLHTSKYTPIIAYSSLFFLVLCRVYLLFTQLRYFLISIMKCICVIWILLLYYLFLHFFAFFALVVILFFAEIRVCPRVVWPLVVFMPCTLLTESYPILGPITSHTPSYSFHPASD